MILSSSAVHGPRLMEGSEWFLQCDLHCLAVLAGWPSFEKSCDANPSATTRHFLTPWMPTKSTNALFSSLDQTLLSFPMVFFSSWYWFKYFWFDAVWTRSKYARMRTRSYFTPSKTKIEILEIDSSSGSCKKLMSSCFPRYSWSVVWLQIDQDLLR